MRGYGAAETVDHTQFSLPDAVRQAHPDGIDVLIDLVSFAALTSLVRPGGTAVTTKYVADPGGLATAGGTGTNFNSAQYMWGELLKRVADALVNGHIVAPRSPASRWNKHPLPWTRHRPAAPKGRPSSRCDPPRTASGSVRQL